MGNLKRLIFMICMGFSIAHAQGPFANYQYKVLLSPEEYSRLPDTIKYEYISGLYQALIRINGENPADPFAKNLMQFLLNRMVEVSYASSESNVVDVYETRDGAWWYQPGRKPKPKQQIRVVEVDVAPRGSEALRGRVIGHDDLPILRVPRGSSPGPHTMTVTRPDAVSMGTTSPRLILTLPPPPRMLQAGPEGMTVPRSVPPATRDASPIPRGALIPRSHAPSFYDRGEDPIGAPAPAGRSMSTAPVPARTGGPGAALAPPPARAPTRATAEAPPIPDVDCINGGFATKKTNGRCLAIKCDDGSDGAQCFPPKSGICVPKGQDVTFRCGQAIDKICNESGGLTSLACKKLLDAYKTFEGDNDQFAKLDRMLSQQCEKEFQQDGVASLEGERLKALAETLRERAKVAGSREGSPAGDSSVAAVAAHDDKTIEAWKKQEEQDQARLKQLRGAQAHASRDDIKKRDKPGSNPNSLLTEKEAECLKTGNCVSPEGGRRVALADAGRRPTTERPTPDKDKKPAKMPGDVAKTCKWMARNLMQIRKYARDSEKVPKAPPAAVAPATIER